MHRPRRKNGHDSSFQEEIRHLPAERRLRPSPFDILNHVADQKQECGLIACERQVEKYNGFGPIWLAKREIFQPVAREVRFGVRREPLLPRLGGFLRYEAAQHLGKMAQGDGRCVPFCPQATCGGGHAHRCRAHCAAPVVPHSFASEAEVGPCRRNGAVRFVVSGLRTNG